MKSFAGFWLDGAVVEPNRSHGDAYDRVVVIDKKAGERLQTVRWDDGVTWSAVYWLDTTTPTELSPQEAFELLKVINPNAERLEDDGGDWCLVEPGSDIINWGDLTEYPPKQHWRVPTDADKGKKCLFWDDGDKYGDKGQGVFLGVHYKGGFLVSREDEPIHVWSRCEVQSEN